MSEVERFVRFCESDIGASVMDREAAYLDRFLSPTTGYSTDPGITPRPSMMAIEWGDRRTSAGFLLTLLLHPCSESVMPLRNC